MTSKERFTRMFEHREADRIPIIDSPWAGTIARWKREGMPEDADWRDYFDVDKSELIYVDTSPRFEQKVLEETPSPVMTEDIRNHEGIQGGGFHAGISRF